MNKIVWGIIGCGDVTEIKSGPAFKLVPNSDLLAVMRRDADKAADYAQRHNIKKWYSNAAELVNDQEVNAIYVATPPSSHEDYTLAAFRSGKPVYVEKPMALDSAECIRMMEAADEYSCKLSVAHYRRAQPKFIKIKELIQDKILGDILSTEITFKQAYKPGTEHTWRTNPAISGGGLFHDLAPHQLDLMLYFFGMPVKVEGSSLNKANLYDADDYVSVVISFENDVQFKGVWDFNAREDEVTDICEITGTKGKLRFAIFETFAELTLDGKTKELIFDHLPHVQQPMIEAVVKYFLNDGPNPCPASEAVEVMKIMDKATGK